MKLYSYFRSSAAYRVRIALNLKGLTYETIPVHLIKGGGEQLTDAYRAINPAALVPTLIDNGLVLGQSMAILDYLDEAYPDPPLLPDGVQGRARVRAIAQSIACDVHPLGNLRVLRYLKRELNIDEHGRNMWYRHWVMLGLTALEAELAGSAQTGEFCHGERPSMADVCLVPQMANAHRYDCDLSSMPTLQRIVAACGKLPAFQAAAPDRQPDAQ